MSEWVDTQRASLMIGHSNRRFIGQLVKQGRLEGRWVKREVVTRRKGMLYPNKRLRDVIEVSVESIQTYNATKGSGRNNPRPCRHLRGSECRCKSCTSEGLSEAFRVYATREMTANIASAAKRLKVTQSELCRQAIVEFLDVREMLEEVEL